MIQNIQPPPDFSSVSIEDLEARELCEETMTKARKRELLTGFALLFRVLQGNLDPRHTESRPVCVANFWKR